MVSKQILSYNIITLKTVLKMDFQVRILDWQSPFFSAIDISGRRKYTYSRKFGSEIQNFM